MKSKKFYAVKVGRKTGIFDNWKDCEKQILGFSGAIYKSFENYDMCKDFLNDSNLEDKKEIDLKNIKDNEAIAYVDGSYKQDTLEYGYGVVLLLKDETLEFFEKGKNNDIIKSRNVTAELFACIRAIVEAKRLKKKKITIFYDYNGIEKWANGLWKCNIPLTIQYKEKIDKLRKEIEIYFVKVKAHTGDTYNERADELAKKSLGIKK